jgi:hypothetical protein
LLSCEIDQPYVTDFLKKKKKIMKELKKAEEEWKKTKSEAIRIRDFHIENLYELLLKSFYERNYCRASKILEILLKCSECDMARIWQVPIYFYLI